MIEIIGLYSLADMPPGKPEQELLAAFSAAGVAATVQGAGTSGSGERDVEVWADCSEDRAWQLIEPLGYAAAWDIESEIPEGYQPGDELV
jgi:hypothetical protein